MIRHNPSFRSDGFAIVLTLVLLALLTVIALAVSSVSRVNSTLAEAKTFKVQARQNALLGLNVAIGKLQVASGPDARVTGMAGIEGVVSSDNSPTRYWTGVWGIDGTFIEWLVSGGADPRSFTGTSIKLVGEKTVGNESNTSSLTGTGSRETEHVIVPLIEILGAPNIPIGHMSYWVGDEGIKISAYVPTSELPNPAGSPLLSDKFTLSSQTGLRDALASQTSEYLSRFISYESLSELDLTPSLWREPFHYTTLRARYVNGLNYVSGRVNINSSSRPLWYSLVSAYNQFSSGVKISQVGSVARKIADAMTVGPFINISEFENSTLLDDALPSTVSPSVFVQVLNDILTVRSDTFRIRAYGDAMNPADDEDATPESVAYCEAIVQRTTEDDPGGNGKKFVITYFRWLGPDDI